MAADWSPAGGPPGNADTAILLAGATVAEGNPQQVNQLQIATGALLLASNTLSVTGRVANAGAILDSGILTVAGSSVTLTGSGQFGLLDNAPAASIAATAPGDMLLNGSTITGGSIGAGGLILSNLAGGVIAAAPLAGSAATLTLNTGTNSIASSGLIEALAKGTLLLQSPVFNSGLLSAAQGNGRVEANCGSLIFQGAMSAGSLAADAGSTLELKPNWYAASGAIAAIDSGLLRIDVTDTGGSFSSVGSLSLPGLLSGQTILVAGTLAGGGSFPGFDHIRDDGTALTFTGGGQTLGSIAFAAGTANLSIGTDANNDAVIIACYAAGTPHRHARWAGGHRASVSERPGDFGFWRCGPGPLVGSSRGCLLAAPSSGDSLAGAHPCRCVCRRRAVPRPAAQPRSRSACRGRADPDPLPGEWAQHRPAGCAEDHLLASRTAGA